MKKHTYRRNYWARSCALYAQRQPPAAALPDAFSHPLPRLCRCSSRTAAALSALPCRKGTPFPPAPVDRSDRAVDIFDRVLRVLVWNCRKPCVARCRTSRRIVERNMELSCSAVGFKVEFYRAQAELKSMKLCIGLASSHTFIG